MTLLKIDLDFQPPEEWMKAWIITRVLILKCAGLTLERISIFKTKRGVHVYIKVKEKLDSMATNLMQFLCGDDPSRVKINMWRIERGIPFWNKLFERKIYSKRHKYIVCHYCGNRIPIDDKLAKQLIDRIKKKRED